MMLADRLKKSVEEILQMSELEVKLWAGYMLYEHDESKKQNVMGNIPAPRPRRR